MRREGLRGKGKARGGEAVKVEKRIVTKRIVLQVGYTCNVRCRFCYYRKALESGKVRDLTYPEIKKRLAQARRLWKTQVDLSGGEPTIRRDIFQIVEHARQIGFRTVCVITNGLRTFDANFCKSLKDSGVNEFLFSLHSPKEEEHDWLTRVKGSWKKVIQSIEHAEALNIPYRTNTVVSNMNYADLDRLYDILKPFHPDAVNLLVYNPSTAEFPEKGEIVDYHVVGEKISRFIDTYEKHFKTINVRWLPFCFLRGNEKNVRTQWQKLYEDQEWDPYFNIKFNKGSLAVWFSFLGGSLIYPFKGPGYGRRDLYTRLNEILSCFRMLVYYKKKGPCKNCSLRHICTGLPRKYKNEQIILSAYDGDPIRDPLYFCRPYAQNFESLRLPAETSSIRKPDIL